MIDGVVVSPRRVIPDERGAVLHGLKITDPEWGWGSGLAEVYFSTCHVGAVKGWHRHKWMTLRYLRLAGSVKLVLFDARENSPTHGEVQEIFLTAANHSIVVVPPMVWNGFKAIGNTPALVANCASHVHDPAEIERADPHGPTVPYAWERKDG